MDWEPIGPFGGSVAVVAVDPHRAGAVVAAAANSLLFRSADGGETWTALPFPAETRAVLHAFAIHPAEAGVYLAGLAGESPRYTGLFRSGDAGATWRRLEGLGAIEVWSLAFWPGDARVIAAGTRDGVFLTRDDGATWNRISEAGNRELQPVVSLAFDPRDSGVLYAGTPHLPWKTADGGKTWRSIRAGMLDDSDVFSIQVDPVRPDRVFASACSGMYRSVNGGLRWTKLTGARGASYRTYFIAQMPGRASTLFAGTTYGLVQSLDGGTRWRKIGTQAARSIAFDPAQPGRFFVATDDAGVLRSDDGGVTLKAVNEGLCNRYLASMAAGNGGLVASATNGAYRLDAGGRWERIAGKAEAARVLAPVPGAPESVYSASRKEVMFSPDAGKTWKTAGTIPGNTAIYGLAALDGRALLAATSAGLMRSEDSGATWAPVPGILENSRISALVRHSGKAGTLFAARYGVIYASGDGGNSWARISPGKSVMGVVTQLVVMGGRPDRLYALTGRKGVFRLDLTPPAAARTNRSASPRP